MLFKEGFGTGLYDTGQLGLNRFRMKTKYGIAFLKEDKVLAKYKILTPKTEKAIAKVKTNGGWFTMNDDYVVLYDDFTYFSFGYPFFDRLGEIIEEAN
ncbi:hypothetical protein AB4Y30_12380 [Ornithinibacillus sp. 4-3]|uniref:GRAM domain-containing protein n=1 Tax=Ornithinibacillus sp. 4-3 TaxID=3231488 RepID=A0AB39HMA9_9BACI